MNNKPLLLTVKETSMLLRIHRPKVYDLIHDGTIAGFKLGADWRIKRESVEKLIGRIPDEFFQDTRKIERQIAPAQQLSSLKQASGN